MQIFLLYFLTSPPVQLLYGGADPALVHFHTMFCGANLRRTADALVLMMQGREVDVTISTDELYN